MSLSLNLSRRLEVNNWMIKARWLYGLGVFTIGALSKFISNSNVNFTILTMVQLLLSFTAANIVTLLLFKIIKKNPSDKKVLFLSWWQIFVELTILVIIMHEAGGIESVSTVFFFMPIISAAFLFNHYGSFTVALLSSIAINSIIFLEYQGYIEHVYRYGEATIEFSSLPIALTKTISISIFYFIVSFYSAFGANLLLKREKALEESRTQLEKKSKQLQRREMRLEEEKNKIEAIISNITDPLIFIDNQHKISLINDAAKNIFKFSKKVVGHKLKGAITNTANLKGLIKGEFTLKKVSGGDFRGDYEEMTLGSGEDTRIFKVYTVEVCYKENICIGFLKIFYDLTREISIDKLKSEFISIAAHQLRTPLSATKWAIKMILEEDLGTLNDEQKDLLKKGYRSNERIITLVNDLLNVSRIEEGKFGSEIKKENLAQIIKEEVEKMMPLAKDNEVELVFECYKEKIEVAVDQERIRLVINNLIDNAVKYTPNYGKVIVRLEEDKEKGNVIISVKDNGVGIPKDGVEKIFSKFFRAANVIKLQTEGNGLGLFITKNIIDMHKGRIDLQSEEGKGTEVTIVLPIVQPK